ncbi:hypothetical protein BDW22DRAFT_908319 [Trametopsis cervina]|nr:hypothetical protein BDW22DRAFT_908319 [Trametopsis cervina]
MVDSYHGEMEKAEGGRKHNHLDVWTRIRKLPVALVILWTTNEWLRNKASDVLPASPPARSEVLTEAIKLLLSTVYFLGQRWWPTGLSAASKQQHLPVYSRTRSRTRSSEIDERPRTYANHGPRISPSMAWALALLSSSFFILYRMNHEIGERMLDPFTRYLAGSVATPLILLSSYLFLSKSSTLSQWQSILLQVSGYTILQISTRTSHAPSESVQLICATILATSIYFLCMEYYISRTLTHHNFCYYVHRHYAHG